MADTAPATEKRLDELYREHPEGFVAGRNEIANDLRDAGEGEEADRIKNLRRPTTAAWLINRIALTSPAQVERLAETSRRLEAAQAQALEGKEQAADEWRAAAESENEGIAGVLERAKELAADAGHPPSGRTLELVEETLRAATGDPELRESVLRGRLEREQSGATLGTPAGGPPPRHGDRSTRRREVAQAQRELERLEEELAEARAREEQLRGRVGRTAETLRQEKDELAHSKREQSDLRRKVKAAKRRASAG